MDRTTATNIVGNALAAQVNEDCENLGINQRYEYTGRVFRRLLGSTLYYEMAVYEGAFKLLRPTYVYPDGELGYRDTHFNDSHLALVED